MAKIYGNVPGLGEISINANGFATENQMNTLIAAMSSRGTSGAAGKIAKANRDQVESTDAVTRQLEAYGDQIDLTGDAFSRNARKFGDQIDETIQGIASAVSDITRSFENIASSSNDEGGKIREITNTVVGLFSKFMDSVSQVANAFGPIGGLVASASQAASLAAQTGAAVVSFVTQTLEVLRDQQRQLTASGVYFSHGIDSASLIAEKAGVSIAALAKAAQNSTEALRRFEGGSAGGLRKVAKAFGALGPETQMLLYSLGYTQDEILSGIANFGSQIDLSGRSMATQDLADESAKYLINLRELDRLTGNDIKTREAAAEALQRETAFRAYLGTLDGDQRELVRNQIATYEKLNPQLAEAYKAQLLGVTSKDPSIAYLQANMPGAMSVIDHMGELAKQGVLTSDGLVEITKNLGIVAKDELEAIQDSFGDFRSLFYLQDATGTAGAIVKNLGTALESMTQLATAAKKSAETVDLEAIRSDQAELTKLLGEYTKTEIDISSIMQTKARELAVATGTFVDGISSLFDEILENWTSQQTAEAKNAEMSQKAFEKIDEINTTQDDALTFLGAYKKIYNDDADPTDLTNFDQINDGLDPALLHNKRWLLDQILNYNRGNDLYNDGLSSGGEVARGMTYLVGEEGPEVITAPSPGQAYANDDPISVKLSDTSDLKSMVDKLSQLTTISQAMLKAMDRGNTLAKQNGYASA